jgi:hypothetical protein
MNVAYLSVIGEFPIRLLLIAVHTNHLICVLPVMSLFSVVTLVSAVLFVAARRNHPISHILEVLTLMRDIHSRTAY